MIKLISDRPTRDLPCCRSVIFFPAGRTPAGKKMTLRQHGRSRVVYRLHTEVGILAVFPDFHEVGKYQLLCGVLNTLLMGVSLSLILISHYPSSFDTARTPTTRASTLVLARVLLSLSSRPRGRTGHERAHRCSLVSFSLSLQDHADARDTSEHIGARSCPHLSLFKTTRTHGTRASTSVLARALISLSSRPRGRTGHERAHWCSLVPSSLSLRHRADAQDTSEHIGARPCPVCPYPSPFDAMGTSRTRASTLVLAHVLVSFSSTPRGRTGHERAH